MGGVETSLGRFAANDHWPSADGMAMVRKISKLLGGSGFEQGKNSDVSTGSMVPRPD